MHKAYLGVLLILMFLAAGCKAFEPDMGKPVSPDIPDNFSAAAPTESNQDADKFFFRSRELDTLIKNAAENNFDIKIARTKIAQAEARIKKENASFWPDLNFSFGGKKKRVQTRTDKDNDPVHVDSHPWDSSLTSSYTLDIWGEARASKKSALLSMQALEQDLETSLLNLAADISDAWIDIIAVRQKKEILQNQIKINQTLLKLQKFRYIHGKADALDVSQQQETLAEASSQFPLLEKQEKTYLNKLAFLSGKTFIDKDIIVKTQTLPEMTEIPSPGLPSEFLKNRHDVKAAWLRLFSSEWEVTAARADRLPALSLSAQALFSHGELDLLFHNWTASLAASIAGPIFDGGYRKAEVKRARAAAEEQLNLYAKTVANAIFEVEDALVSIQKQSEYIELLKEELKLTKLTLKDADIQYRNGQSSYLSYLTAWTNIERLERQLIGEEANICKEFIKLKQILELKPVQ